VDEGKLSLESKDIAAEKRQELLRLFPEVQTEDGRIDFDQLKRALGESVDAGRERYGMTWPGKADCFRLIQSPSTATLLPVRRESVRFDESENMIIEGDNLEVLKLLQKGYQNRVKMIYIDPPYNTGNDFIYPDDFADNLKNYLQYTGQADSEGKRFSDNPHTDGRFHSKWLNMMYPRLYLARNLLREDGVIFISIDDGEISNLRQLCDQIFGIENFLASIIWQKKYAVSNDDPGIAPMHDYIVAVQRSGNFARNLLPRTEKQTVRYTNTTNDPRGVWSSDNYISNKSKEERPTLWYPIRHPRTGEDVWPEESAVWRYSKEKHATMEAEDRLYWGPDQSYRRPRLKRFLAEIQDGVVPSTWWPFTEVGHNDEGQKETAEILGPKVFSTPKPIRLLKRLVSIGTGPNDLILDFFAGSGGMGQAILELNSVGSNRNFILVQLPEPTERDDYRTIADITKERVRRVLHQQDKETESRLDLQTDDQPRHRAGFRVFKLAPSNFKVWDAHTDEGVEGVERQMELAVNHIMPDRTAEDLFYEILMKSEYPLTAKVENFDAAGIPAFSVEDDSLIVCVERKVTAEAVAVIAKRSPSKVIFLDEAFSGNDQLKANAKMNFESAGVKRFETV
jgi:adenine-specific DNA-methyltransferase